jgi:predicted RNase H-like HicB family nuclease
VSESIECEAVRRGRLWVAHLPEHGVYSHGRTLAKTRQNTRQGLELIGVDAEVTVIAVTPELERLRAAREVYAAALSEAVSALALRRTTLHDIAAATGEPARQVKQLLPDAAARRP